MNEISPTAKPVTIKEAIKLLMKEHSRLVHTDGSIRLMVAITMGIKALEVLADKEGADDGTGTS